MIIVVGDGHGEKVQIQDEADSRITNNLEKGKYPLIRPSDMGK